MHLRDSTLERLRSAPGRKVLVIGNHEVNCAGNVDIDGFHEIHSTLYGPGNPPLLLTHMPLRKRAGWLRQRPRPPPQPGVAFEDAPHQRQRRAVALPAQAVGGHLQTGPPDGRRRHPERPHDGPAADKPSLIGAEPFLRGANRFRSTVSRNLSAGRTVRSATASCPDSLMASGRQVPHGRRALAETRKALGRIHAQRRPSCPSTSPASASPDSLSLYDQRASPRGCVSVSGPSLGRRLGNGCADRRRRAPWTRRLRVRIVEHLVADATGPRYTRYILSFRGFSAGPVRYGATRRNGSGFRRLACFQRSRIRA